MKRNHVHSVSDDALMSQLGIATKLTPSRALILQLKDAGRAAMERFLTRHWRSIGETSSVNLRAMFSAEGAQV
jgi:NTE family protein